MISLRKPAAGIVAAAVLVPLTLIGSAGTASAQTTTCDLRPRGTIVGAKTKTVDFNVPSATEFTYELPELGLYVYDTEVDGDGSFAEIGPELYKNSDAGAHQGEVQRVRRSDGEQDTCTATWRIKRATRLQDVKVSRIEHGRKLTGRLERVVWGKKPDDRWTSYSKGSVSIYFENARGKWQNAGSAELTKGGRFTFTKQIGERRWRLYFQGDNLSGSSPEIEVKG
ncbi:hypothetical protein LWF15_01700 [Kineosporia rhizophila]|uniref:hypothetical protein n=1 Tax=Kineosporia TaxID=49184 RepID=UPI001E4F9634|nr:MULTISPECIES: hypothetical protein [Kineosporia]MCE0534213.1 hypothetical protein [Kineosporia rhizophila]GLY13760.1 hypothetical protein Kisp01_07760 [Kineosporia sp. NBRC 101677]